MSVYAFVLNPETEEEEKLRTPVSTEIFFNKYWLSGAEELGLKWIPTFSAGMDVIKEYVPEIINELRQLKKWAKEQPQLSQDEKEYMITRIELLEERLPLAFQREDAVMFIG